LSDDRKSSQGDDLDVDDLHVKAKQDRTGTTIVLEGEFDMAGTWRFWAFVSEVLAAGPRSITVDARGLEFIDSSGLLALLRARDAATEAGVEFRVSDPSPIVRRIAELGGVKDLLLSE
jgi:anti-sigma B factor antagonist